MNRCKMILSILSLTACVLLGSCNFDSKSEIYEKDIFALDTFINLKIYGDNGEENGDIAERKITELENTLSVTRSGSDVSDINSNPTFSTKVSEDTVSILKTAADISKVTDGAFDVSVYPIVKLWGFTTDENKVPTQSEIDSALPLVDYTKISLDEGNQTVTLDENMQIDFGAVAKGYIAQETANALKENGVESAVLAFGGNIQTIGLKNGEQWQIGVRYPDTTDNFAVLSVGETAIVTSAADQRYFEENGKRYHHIIDPKTGFPAENGTLSVTVVCPNGARADGFSTALFVMGAEKAAELYKAVDDIDFIILTSDNKVYVTEGLRERFTLSEDYEYLNIEYVEK